MRGDEIAWINPLGGDFGTAANWDPARVPTATDRARFEVASTYAVQLGGARTLAGALVRASLLDLLGGPLTLAGAFGVGNGARLTLATATVRSSDVTIGDSARLPEHAANHGRRSRGGGDGAHRRPRDRHPRCRGRQKVG